MRRALFATFLFLILTNAQGLTNAQELAAEPYAEMGHRLDRLILDTTVRPFNGVILISQGSKSLYSRAHGFSNFETKTPIKLSDKFRIQSNSKQITAVLVLKQAERGTIDLNSPISTYLPELEQPWAKAVTVHQLLNMTSGIKSLDEDLLFPPGTDFYYSNPGYGLLGAVLQKVTGKSYLILADELFADLGMHNTHSYKFDSKSDVIDGYVDSGDGLKRLDFEDINFSAESWERFAPAGGIISTAADLLLWDSKLHKGRLLSDAMYQKLSNYSILSPDVAFNSDKVGYGYGVTIDDKSAKKHIGHAGRGIGFASIKFYIPEDDICVIVLENVYMYDQNSNPEMIYHFEREIRSLVLEILS